MQDDFASLRVLIKTHMEDYAGGLLQTEHKWPVGGVSDAQLELYQILAKMTHSHLDWESVLLGASFLYSPS